MPTWPEINYGTKLHSFDSGQMKGYAPTISIPRPKYTWFVYFELNPTAYAGNLIEGMRTGKVLAAMKSVDHPQTSYKVEKLVSYNRVRNVPTSLEYKPCTLTFFDDTTSYVAGLLKSYRNHYHYSAEAQAASDFGDGVGSSQRTSLPSTGMKLRSNGRNFFEKIVILDLGTAPNCVNTYHLVNPVVSDVSHQSLDYDDLTGKTEVSLTLEYEGYYERVGEPIGEYSFIFEQLTGDMTVVQADDRVGGFLGDFDLGDDILSNTLEQVVGNVIEGAPAILSGAFANGEFNSKNFKSQLFRHASRGTPIQDVRNAVTSVTLAKQRLDQKDFVGVLASARRLGSSVGNLGKIVFNDSGGEAVSPSTSTNDASVSASDLIRQVGSSGIDWTDF